jgi:glucose/arabinose dehydrogenase
MRARSLGLVLLAGFVTSACEGGRFDDIQLPPGFAIELYSDQVPEARSLARGSGGTVFVSTRKSGVLYALTDRDGDHKADRVYTLAAELNTPNGIAFHDGALYVATREHILRYPNIENRLQNPPEPQIIADGFPTDSHHGWRYLAVGPDNKLYVSIGAPCNVCERAGYANIQRLNLDGSGLEIYAEGVRNSVGFDWHPQTGELWFTDNGRDRLGDDVPPDELNRAPGPGVHFGFPYCHGDGIADPEFGADRDCSSFTPPAQPLGPHVASLGMRFYDGKMFPSEYQGDIFIAEHGSWNRSERIGYRISRIELDADGTVSAYRPFTSGWLKNEVFSGRPVDVLVMPDGALLVSDDHNGAVYRISYQGDNR